MEQFMERVMNLFLEVISELSEEEIDAWRGKLNASHLGFVRGDFTQDQILEKANISKAKAVLLLPNLIKTSGAEADEKTALAAYSIKALAPKTKVYAYILYHENKSKLRRAKVDGIIVADLTRFDRDTFDLLFPYVRLSSLTWIILDECCHLVIYFESAWKG